MQRVPRDAIRSLLGRVTQRRELTGPKGRFPIGGVLLVTILLGALTWLILPLFGPTFYGRPQAYWINSLESGPEAANRLRLFGPEAVPILLKALKKRPGPGDRAYSWLWPKLPSSLQSKLPRPSDYSQTRARAAGLLSHLGDDAKIPAQPLATAVKDEVWIVRMNALVCLDRAVLPSLGSGKDEILPTLVESTKDSKVEVRMLAVYALRHFKDQGQVVVPVLTNALTDSYSDVRYRAAKALYEIDPTTKPRVMEILKNCPEGPMESPFGAGRLARDFLQQIGETGSNP